MQNTARRGSKQKLKQLPCDTGWFLSHTSQIHSHSFLFVMDWIMLHVTLDSRDPLKS